MATFGAEIEKPVSNKTGEVHSVSQPFFDRLATQALRRGSHVHLDLSTVSPNTALGVVSSDLGEQGLDNGFNLLETAIPYQPTLSELHELIQLDLQTVQTALEAEGATITNLSIHPLGSRDPKTYQALVAPKSIYPYIRHRGWDHTAGIDARAQNSPTTGVEPQQAARAVSTVIGAGAAFIGLYANSPFEEGRVSSTKETRLTMWDRMMENATVEGDRKVSQFPPNRFDTMAQYFHWMFGHPTGIHFVVASGNGSEYKNLGDRILVVEGNPAVLDYLGKNSWTAHYLKDLLNGDKNNPVELTPDISHMSTMQFAQFAGARIRYGLNNNPFPLAEFLQACSDPLSTKVEDIFAQHASFVYIEGRDPGANFPDMYTHEQLDKLASTVTVSPSAVQAGLIANLEEAYGYICGFDWNHLKLLRDSAIKNGLQGEAAGVTVASFTNRILEIASRGLSSTDQKLLEYPLHVLRTNQNGADRALNFMKQHPGALPQALLALVQHRAVVV